MEKRFTVRYIGENEANAPWAVWDNKKNEIATCQFGLIMAYPSEGLTTRYAEKANRGEVKVDL